jgi:hypothetical protein
MNVEQTTHELLSSIGYNEDTPDNSGPLQLIDGVWTHARLGEVRSNKKNVHYVKNSLGQWRKASMYEIMITEHPMSDSETKTY